MTFIAASLVLVGLAIAVAATRDRRRRWRDASPHVGGERAAPEPVIVPNRVVYLVYLGWAFVAAGVAAAMLR